MTAAGQRPGTEAGRSARAMAAGLQRARARRVVTAALLTGSAVALLCAGAPLAVAGGLLALAAVAALNARAVHPQRWTMGAAGEEATAHELDRLSPRRWAVWHDLRVPGSRANIDHLVVGRSGVWVIDTKTTRAPVRANWWGVHFGDRRLDTGAVRWEAGIVADRLAGRLGRDVPVRPLVAVHGDGVGRRGGRSGGVRVVPASAVADRIRRGRKRLSRSEIDHVCAAVGGDLAR